MHYIIFMGLTQAEGQKQEFFEWTTVNIFKYDNNFFLPIMLECNVSIFYH